MSVCALGSTPRPLAEGVQACVVTLCLWPSDEAFHDAAMCVCNLPRNWYQARGEGIRHKFIAPKIVLPPVERRTARVLPPKLSQQYRGDVWLAQTLVFPPVERGTATEPPPTAAASGSCSPGEMYDEYAADQERARAAEEASRARAAAAKKVRKPYILEPQRPDKGFDLGQRSMKCRAARVRCTTSTWPTRGARAPLS